MRAQCLVRTGDTAAGVAHARDAVGRLPSPGPAPSSTWAGGCSRRCPPARRHADDAMELRALVDGR